MFKQSIIIPDYPDRIVVSRTRRPVYYVKPDSRKKGVKKVPKKYSGSNYGYNREGYLIDKRTKEKLVANTRSTGKPRTWVVNFQEIWNGNVARQKRAHYMNILKDQIRPYITQIDVVPSSAFPIAMEIQLFNQQFTVDASNKGAIYTKIVEDLLVSEGKIPDDSPLYVRDTGRIVLNFIEEGRNSLMIINISSYEAPRV